MKILVIIDMQPKFEASKDEKTQAAVVTQIKLAKRHNWPIVVVEFAADQCRQQFEGWEKGPLLRESPTHFVILKEVEKYPRFLLVLKDADDGSAKIISARNKQSWRAIRTFRVMGVNTGACVKKTAAGLAVKYSVEVYAPGCNAPEWSVNDNPWMREQMPQNITWEKG